MVTESNSARWKLVFMCCSICDSGVIEWIKKLHSITENGDEDRGAVPFLKEVDCCTTGKAYQVTLMW